MTVGILGETGGQFAATVVLVVLFVVAGVGPAVGVLRPWRGTLGARAWWTVVGARLAVGVAVPLIAAFALLGKAELRAGWAGVGAAYLGYVPLLTVLAGRVVGWRPTWDDGLALMVREAVALAVVVVIGFPLAVLLFIVAGGAGQ